VRHSSLILKNGAIAAAALALLAGCIAVPADTRPAAAIDLAARAQHAPAITLPADAWPAEQWWTTYGDPQLNALIQRALKDNPGLALGQQRDAAERALLERARHAKRGQL
jgi:multidrug efflux system outer membrane protein